MNRRTAGRLAPLDQVLLDTLAEHTDALSTAQLRIHVARQGGQCAPVVHETVYHALERLRRLGLVEQHKRAGRHTFWSLVHEEVTERS
jgi:Fe2+ or Zn2+ uptake regulation protein